MENGDRLTITGVAANAMLFILKAAAALASGSLAVLSDALNSLLDIVSYTLIYITVKISRKEADSDHQFGHHRAEPLAAIVMAIFAGILGFEVIKAGVFGLMEHKAVKFTLFPVVVLVFTMIVKTIMSYYFKVVGIRLNSPAIMSGSVDSRNDVFVSAVALLGYVGSNYSIGSLDEIAAVIIGGWIIKSGYDIGARNIDYLMGKAPDDFVISEIRSRAQEVKGVIHLNTVRAHYVGHYIQAEVHINVDKKMSTEDSHAIAKRVQKAVEAIPSVTYAFIHVDPT